MAEGMRVTNLEGRRKSGRGLFQFV